MFETIYNRLVNRKPDPEGSIVPNWANSSWLGFDLSYADAIRYTAVWSCVRVIADTLSIPEWCVFVRDANGEKTKRPDHPISHMLTTAPNEENTAFSWRETMIANALTWGDGYSEIDRDTGGRPMQLSLIEPHRVELKRTVDGQLFYTVNNGSEQPRRIAPENMFHLHGLGESGLSGYYVIHLFRDAIRLGLATEDSARSFFENDATPAGFLKHPGKIDREKATTLLDKFNEYHKGSKKRRRVGLLQNGMEFVTVGTSNEDSEQNETRRTQVLEICRIFRVPPHKICELTNATYSNIAEQETAFVRDSIVPWAVRFEQEANRKLFPQTKLRTVFTKINTRQLSRGDAKTQAEFYEIMQRLGVFSVNDILESEDMNKIGPDGDKRLVPMNFTTLDKIGEEEPEPEPIAGRIEQIDEDEAEDSTETPTNRARRLVGPVLLQACQRLQTRYDKESARQKSKQNGHYETWLAEYFPNDIKHATGVLLNAAELFVNLGEFEILDVKDKVREFCLDCAIATVNQKKWVYQSADEMTAELMEELQGEVSSKTNGQPVG